MRKIIWSDDAEIDYSDNIDFLLKNWSEKEAEEFINKVDNILYNLKNKLVNYRSSSFQNIKQCVVCKQITLFYRIIEEDNIELVRFWNNYQDDKKLIL